MAVKMSNGELCVWLDGSYIVLSETNRPVTEQSTEDDNTENVVKLVTMLYLAYEHMLM